MSTYSASIESVNSDATKASIDTNMISFLETVGYIIDELRIQSSEHKLSMQKLKEIIF